MATVSELKAQRDALVEQRSSGVASVSYKGRTVNYRSVDEIDRAIAGIEREITKAERRRPLRQLRVIADKGL